MSLLVRADHQYICRESGRTRHRRWRDEPRGYYELQLPLLLFI